MDLVEQLQLDMGTHFYMSLAGFEYPMSRHEMASTALWTRFVNVTQAEGAPPFKWGWPWPETHDADAVTVEEREASRTTLKAHSAFGQIRT